jgi:Rrf2 family cysteine metabolism transcriptional repressor
MKISKKTEYGLRAMVYLAKHSSKEGVCSIKEISKEERISFDFLEKIMSKLEKSSLIKSKKGVSGGYYLAKKADKITPGDIVAVLEENMAQVHCSGCPMAGGCSSGDMWNEVQQSLDNSLNARTLEDLIK